MSVGHCIEIWRPIPGWDDYEVSDCGCVRSGRRHVDKRMLKPGGSKYPHVTLCDGVQKKVLCVHHLVLEAFIGPRPPGMVGCHRDDDKKNNRLENLYWGYPDENYADRTRNGKTWAGEQHALTKISAETVQSIRDLYRHGNALQRELADQFGISQTHVSRIIRGESWSGLAGGSRS